MDDFKGPFVFTRGERIAVISLMSVILILVVCNLLSPIKRDRTVVAFHNLDSLIQCRQIAFNKRQEQYRAERSQMLSADVRLTPFHFNPNTMSESDWKNLGLTDRQIRGIMNYIAKGGYFYSKRDFKNLYAISEQEFEILEPYIVIPENRYYKSSKTSFTEEKDVRQDRHSPQSREIPIVDINIADSLTLEKLPRIGAYTAHRILTYREKLGGYLMRDQLLEVMGVDSTRYAAFVPYIVLQEGFVPQKKDVNRSDFKTLLSHPYLDYEMVKAIVRYRESRGMIRDWQQLLTVLGEQNKPNAMLEYYVTY